MADAVIGALRVTLGMDTAAFSRGARSAESRLQTFGQKIGPVIKQVAAIGVAAAAAGAALVTALVVKQVGVISAQVDLAKRVGASVAAIQALQHAGEQAGVSNEALAKTLGTINARLGEAAREGAGPAFEALQRLGLSARELSEMDADERIKTLSDRMKELGYSTQQQADALRNLGVRNQEVINLFQEGSAAIEKARRDLEAWGVLLSDVDASKVEAAGDAIDRIGTILTGVANQIAVQISPYVVALAEGFSDAAKETHGFGGAIENTVARSAKALGGLLDWLHKVRYTLTAVQALATGIDLNAAKLLPWRSGEVDGLRTEFQGLRAEVEELANAGLPSEQIDAWMAKARAVSELTAELNALHGDQGAAGAATDEPTDAETKAAEAAQTRLDALRTSMLTEREAELNNYAQRMIDLQDFHDQKMMSDQEYAELSATAAEQHAGRLKEIDEEVVKSARDAAAKKQQVMLSAAGEISGIIGELFQGSKVAAIAQAVISAYEGISRTLGAYPFPLNLALAAGHAAVAFAQISKLRAVTPTSSSASGPSSSGGGAAAAAAGGKTGGGAETRNVDVRISGLSRGSLFDGAGVRDLIERINEQIGDGVQLRLA